MTTCTLALRDILCVVDHDLKIRGMSRVWAVLEIRSLRTSSSIFVNVTKVKHIAAKVLPSAGRLIQYRLQCLPVKCCQKRHSGMKNGDSGSTTKSLTANGCYFVETTNWDQW